MTPAGFDKRQIINDNTAKHITRVEELGYELIVDEVMTHDIVTFDADMTNASGARDIPQYAYLRRPSY